MNQKSLDPFLITASVISGALLSGYLARAGGISAGHDPTAAFPFPDLTGFFIFIFGALACPALSFILVKFLSRILPDSPYRAIFTTLIIPALIAFPTGVAAYRWNAGNRASDSAKAAEYHQIQRAKSDALQARLIADPEIALRERWFEWRQSDKTLRYLFMESLKSPQVPYSLAQLETIYQEAPEVRALVVVHPACDPAFLTSHWSRALEEAEAGNPAILLAIASNPKTPKTLLEKLESLSFSSPGKVPPPLKQVLDARLYREDLVMSRHQMIQAATEIGSIKIHADSDLGRSCEWKSETRSATLEARREDKPDAPTHYFYGFGENGGQANVTTRIEFLERRKSFPTPDQAFLWIHQQSERIPTVYRNDGLLVSSNMNSEKNQLTIEVWQILISMNKPASLPGGDDAKITVEAPDPEN